MIRTERAYQQALQRLREQQAQLREHRERLQAEGLEADALKRALEPISSFHLQLKDEVQAFERLKQGELGDVVNLHGLGRMLVALRTAKGMTQTELARRLDVHESQVSRDERNEYHGVTVERASKVLDALGVELLSGFEDPVVSQTSVHGYLGAQLPTPPTSNKRSLRTQMGRNVNIPTKPGDPVFAFRSNQPAVWYHKNSRLSNKYCLYCWADVSDGAVASDKEHLVGREFVPTGTLDGTAFNLIFRGCKECNAQKAALERHVSTLTLLTSPARSESAEIDKLALRKAKKDFHPHRKGSAVMDAHNEFDVPFNVGPATGRFGFVGPPQLDHDAATELACRHVQGFFSLITSMNPTEPSGTLLLDPANVFHVRPFPHRDWGNPQLLEIVNRVQGWEKLGVVTTAKGFFQAEFRRDAPVQDGGTAQWFWALEWNKSTRVIGVIKRPDEALPLFDGLPPLKWMRVSSNERARRECPLAPDEEDLLFRHDMPRRARRSSTTGATRSPRSTK